MAKKKIVSINNMMDEFDESIAEEKKKGGVVTPAEAKQNGKEKGSAWRKSERPVAKSILFERKLSAQINQIKEWRSMAGEENATVQDIIHEMCEEYIANHMDELREKYKDLIF